MTNKEYLKAMRKIESQITRGVITPEQKAAKIAELVQSGRVAGLQINDDGTLVESTPAATETPVETAPAAPAATAPAAAPAATAPAAAPAATAPAAKPAKVTPAAKQKVEFKVKVDQLLSFMRYWLHINAASLAPAGGMYNNPTLWGTNGVGMLAHYRANRQAIDKVLPMTQQSPQLIAWEMQCTNKCKNNTTDENGPKDGFRIKTGRRNANLPENVTGELGTVLCFPQWWREDSVGRGVFNVQWNIVRNYCDALDRNAAAATTPAATAPAETPVEETVTETVTETV